jgi:FHS family L-fucose permease-like MFS transporter
MGGSGMVMAIAGAALLTQIQGILSDQSGSINFSYWIPAIAFGIIAYYSLVVCRKNDKIQVHQS